MQSKKRWLPALRLVRRESAERHLFIILLSFAASVTLTRAFLTLTGYPRLGGGNIHIAHVLWGGLLLFAAALLPLIVANPWAFTASSLLSGVGVGLFIDEVGKFITSQNDYFYPTAAPIVYTFFLVTLLLLLRVRRISLSSAQAELQAILAEIAIFLGQPISSTQSARLRSRLEKIRAEHPQGRIGRLARALLNFLKTEEIVPDPEVASRAARLTWLSMLRLPKIDLNGASAGWLRALLIAGLLAIGLLSLKNPATVLLAGWLPPQVVQFLQSLYIGRKAVQAAAPFWVELRIVLELVVGFLLIASAALLAMKKDRMGARLGIAVLVLSLTTVNLLLFYFEQFSTILTTAFQFLLLAGLQMHRYRLEQRK